MSSGWDAYGQSAGGQPFRPSVLALLAFLALVLLSLFLLFRCAASHTHVDGSFTIQVVGSLVSGTDGTPLEGVAVLPSRDRRWLGDDEAIKERIERDLTRQPYLRARSAEDGMHLSGELGIHSSSSGRFSRLHAVGYCWETSSSPSAAERPDLGAHLHVKDILLVFPDGRRVWIDGRKGALRATGNDDPAFVLDLGTVHVPGPN